MAPTNTGIPSEYVDREQALIKHALLKGYLEKLFLIVGSSSPRTRIGELCYVDCFAGPWDVGEDALGTTSIAISLGILARCRNELAKQNVHVPIRALFIEKKTHAYKRLVGYLAENAPTGVDAQALHGDFSSLRNDILDWCGNRAFAFFFVDPTGWSQITIDHLRPLLMRPRSEFLVTFVYDWINRTASMPNWTARVKELLGESLDLAGLEPAQRERAMLSAYRRSLKAAMMAENERPAHSAYVRVLDPEKERPKYHLVYLTRHPRGLIEFMRISEGVDIIQRKVRAVTHDRRRTFQTGTPDMFGAATFVDDDSGRVSAEAVEQFWLAELGSDGKQVGESEFADMLERTDWFPADFQAALGRLIDRKVVRNSGAVRRRPKKPLHWEGTGEFLERVEEQS